MVKIIKEHFTSINQMMEVINNRPNNYVMRNNKSSQTGSKDFTGTSSYEDATSLIINGDKEIYNSIKKEVTNSFKQMELRNKHRTFTTVVGYNPHVPNAIIGLPNSMINMETIKQKVKVVSLLYNITINANTSSQKILKSGICMLSIINKLELQGYRINLQIILECAKKGTERTFVTVDIKDYREQLDLLKVSFPIASASMLRRFGFKWTETNPYIKEEGWSIGYGEALMKESESFLKQNNLLEKNQYYFDILKIEDFGFNEDRVINSMNLQ